MEGALVSSNLSMSGLYPSKANADHAPISRRLSYISAAASQSPNHSCHVSGTEGTGDGNGGRETVNVWEEAGAHGEEIVMVAANILSSVEHMLERMELVHASVELVRINLRTGNVTRTPLSAGNLDLGVISPGCLGRRNRYGYFGVGNPMPKIGGVAKLDFDRAGEDDCTVARRDFEEGCFAGEPFFVPDLVEGSGKEDDGYVVCYMHNEGTGDNQFVVMDARTPELDIVAEVQLPSRVPYGIHGPFLTHAELCSQQIL